MKLMNLPKVIRGKPLSSGSVARYEAEHPVVAYDYGSAAYGQGGTGTDAIEYELGEGARLMDPIAAERDEVARARQRRDAWVRNRALFSRVGFCTVDRTCTAPAHDSGRHMTQAELDRVAW